MKINMRKLFIMALMMLSGVHIKANILDEKLNAISPQIEAIADRLYQATCSEVCDGATVPIKCRIPLMMYFKDAELTKALHKVLVAGLFIDEFSNPLIAFSTVGLANKIYALRVDDNNMQIDVTKPPFKYLPINFNCSGDKPYKLEYPYNDLRAWAKDEFNMAKLLGKTAQNIANQMIINNGFLFSLTRDEYKEAIGYWGIATK